MNRSVSLPIFASAWWVGFVTVTAISGVHAMTAQASSLDIQTQKMGQLPDGSQIDKYTLTNSQGLRVEIMTYGATIIGVEMPDRNGRRDNITLHLDGLEDYVKGHPLFGSLVGRYANRISGASFAIDGTRYQLERNAGKNHIHGGRNGFQRLAWQAGSVRQKDRVAVVLRHISPDGDAGYPGTLKVTVTYALTEANELVMDYQATTDKPTHVNLTNHTYWNLAGAGSGNVLEHVVFIDASRCLIASESRFPTGALANVAGTPLDFTKPHTVGSRINELPSKNYDDCYVLNKSRAGELSLAARVVEPASGRVMEVLTTQPGVQFYTAKGLKNRPGADGAVYGPYQGLCLETQHFPDSPNKPSFPSTLLHPGATYHQVTVHRFHVLK